MKYLLTKIARLLFVCIAALLAQIANPFTGVGRIQVMR